MSITQPPRPRRRTTRRPPKTTYSTTFVLWPFILITPGLLIYALEWTRVLCTTIGLCSVRDPGKHVEELSQLSILLTRQVIHAQTVFLAAMALGNPAGHGIPREMKYDFDKLNPRKEVADKLQPFFESAAEVSKGLKPLHNVAKFDIIKAVRRISRSADIDIPHLAAGSLWRLNRAQAMSTILSECLASIKQPFDDLSSILDRAVPIAEYSAARAHDAKRDIGRAKLKDGGPESLRVAIKSVPVVYENMRLIQDYLRWYTTLSHDTFVQAPSLDLDTALSDLRLSVSAFRAEWDKAMAVRVGEEHNLPHLAKVMKEVPLSLVGRVVVVPKSN